MTTGSSPTQPGSRVGALKYQTAHGFRRGQPVYGTPATGKYTLATEATGFDGVVGSIPSANQFELVTAGQLDNITSVLTAGPSLYLSTSPGVLRTTGNTLVFKAQSADKAVVQPAHAGTAVTTQTGTVSATGFTSAANTGAGKGVFNPATSTTSKLAFKTFTTSGSFVLTDNGSSLDLGYTAPPPVAGGIDIQAAYDAMILAEASCVGFWKGNEAAGSANILDYKGANPMPVGSTTVIGMAGPIAGTGDGAFRTDGNASGICTASSNTGMPSGSVPFTLECWALCRNSGASPCIISVGNSSYMGLQINGEDLLFTSLAFGSSAIAFRTRADDQLWHHYVLTTDGAGVYNAYMDGKFVGTNTSGVTTIGGFVAPGNILGSARLNGSIARVAAYNIVLPAARVAAHYATGKLGFAP